MSYFRLFILIIIFIPSLFFPQNLKWTDYTNISLVTDFAVSNEYLYISTLGGGLIKMNISTEEKTFYNRSNSEITDHNIVALDVDEKGIIWMSNGGDNYDAGGITAFDGKNWKTYLKRYNNSSNDPWNSDRWYDMVFDNENNLWLTGGTGTAKFNGESWEFFSEDSSGHSLVGYNIEKDIYGNIWISTHHAWHGIKKYDGKSWEFFDITVDSKDEYTIENMTADNEGNIWFTTFFGLVKFNEDTIQVFNKENFGLPYNYVYSIAFDRKNNIYVGLMDDNLITPRGLGVYNGTEWKVYTKDNSVIPDNFVFCVTDDTMNNTIWIGTGKGYVKYNNDNFKSFSSSNSLLGEYSGNIISDKMNNIWIDNYPFLTKIVGETWDIFESSENGLLKDSFTMKSDTNNDIWFWFYDNKVLKTLSDNKWTEIDIPQNLNINWVSTFNIDENNNLWFAASTSNGKSLIKYDHTNWSLHSVEPSLDFQNMRSITFDSSNVIWIGTDNGMLSYNGYDWSHFNQDNWGFPIYDGYEDVLDIFIDSAENFWISTYKGVIFYDKIIWKYYPFRNCKIVEDKIGNLWFGHLFGVDNYDGTNWTHLDRLNSKLPSNRIESIGIDKNNKVWVSLGYEGVAVFDPKVLSDIEYNHENPIKNSFKLYQNYPNPFNPSTKISFTIQKESLVTR